jgi:crotonobetainyl-CoA:carnitine CoA-transferase CaiB-like acyl-CoA transferase
MTAALEGVRVLDFSIWMFGPICTQVLGDFGADVVKVEPLGGEPGRGIGMNHPTTGGVSARYLSRNRNKKSICLDLRNPASRDVLERFVARSDVTVQNFRYEDFAPLNDRLIYVCGTGYGLTGPYQSMGGQDRAAQAMSGFTYANGNPGTVPLPARTSIMDVFGGMLMTQGVLLALRARELTGQGQRVDLSLLDAAIASNTYRTKDSYLQLVMVFVRHGSPLRLLCEIVGIDDLSADPRFDGPVAIAANAQQLTELLQDVFATRTTDEWLELLRPHDIICVPVYNFAQVFQDPQVVANDLVREVVQGEAGTVRLLDQPIRLSATPAKVAIAPPTVGEHTDELLVSLGFDDGEIATLRDARVVA